MSEKDQQHTHGAPDGDADAETTLEESPEPSGTTDENGMPVDNPSGG